MSTSSGPQPRQRAGAIFPRTTQRSEPNNGRALYAVDCIALPQLQVVKQASGGRAPSSQPDCSAIGHAVCPQYRTTAPISHADCHESTSATTLLPHRVSTALSAASAD